MVAMGVAAVLVCAACGEEASGADTGAATGADAAPALDGSHPFGSDPSEEGEPVDGGTVTVGQSSEANSLDPAAATGGDAGTAIYDSLMRLDEESQPQPYLAKSMTTPDKGLTWVIALRPGVTFHDGTPLDADAVIFSLQRHIDAVKSPAHLLASQISSMTAVDPLTARLTLKSPVGSFPAAFALQFYRGNLGAIVSPAAVRQWGADFGRHPVGAGPFKFKEWVPQNHLTLVKHEQYWQKGLPRLDELVFRSLPDLESRYASVVNGDIDIDAANYHSEIFRASGEKDLKVYYGQGGGGNYMAMNQKRAPFDDRRMREALISAIDYEALEATQFYGAMDPARTVFPPGSPFYSKKADDAYPDFDQARARELIADYEADGGVPAFTLTTSNSPNNQQLSQFMQAQWAAVGLDVEVRLLDLAQWVATAQARDFQVGTVVNGPFEGPYPNAVNLLHSGGTLNYSQYANSEMDAALDKAVRATDSDEQVAAWKKVDEIASRDLAVAWIARAYQAQVTQPEVRGVVKGLTRDTLWATMWKSTE